MRRTQLVVICSLFLCSFCFAQTPATEQFKKAVVRIESILERYDQKQVDILTQKKLDSIGHVISQHETYDILDGFASTKDTIRGTGIMVNDGNKIYLVTTKHIAKMTGLDAVNDLLTI